MFMDTKNHISRVILEMSQKYITEHSTIESVYDINNGMCMDFATDVVNCLGGESDVLYVLNCENFMIGLLGNIYENVVWDIEMIGHYWKDVHPPNKLKWVDLNAISFGYHVWIYFNGMHYDAECPNGVKNFFKLPIYQKRISQYILNRTNIKPRKR